MPLSHNYRENMVSSLGFSSSSRIVLGRELICEWLFMSNLTPSWEYLYRAFIYVVPVWQSERERGN